MKSKDVFGFFVATVISGALWGSAEAATANYSVDAGVGRSDNIRRTSTNAESETIGTASVEFAAYENTRRLQAQMIGDLAYFDYFHHTYNSEVIGNFAGNANFQLVPERIQWNVQDNFGQIRTDPFAAVTPDNRENINYFTTGPTFIARLGSQNSLRLSAEYSKISYETTPNDNDRISGAVGLVHNLSALSAVSANVQVQKINYDSALAIDYKRQDAFLRYAINGGRTTATADLGYTKLQRDSAPDSSGLLARLDFTRRVSASSTLSLRLGREFTDPGSSFQFQQTVQTVNLDTGLATATSASFTDKYAVLGWDFLRQRTGLGISLSHYDENYDLITTFNQKRTLGNAYVSRALAPNLLLLVGLSYLKNDFTMVPGDYREKGASAALTWQLGRRLSLTGRYEHYDRSSELAGGDYRENRLWLTISYGTKSPGSRELSSIPAPMSSI